MADAPTQKRKKNRSPSYPAIGLEEALRRARTLHDQDGRNAAPVATILDHWGYKPGSGPGVLAIAALRKFGLLEYVGTGPSRQGRLTDLALKIILDDREVSPERDEAIREAAMRPTIHSELRQRFPERLPSDGNIKHYLTYERKFTAQAAEYLIEEFKGTLAYARLLEGGNVPINDESAPAAASGEAASEQVTPPVTPPAPPVGETRRLQLALSSRVRVTVEASNPLTEDDWKRMLVALDAQKPGLVEEEFDPWALESDEE